MELRAGSDTGMPIEKIFSKRLVVTSRDLEIIESLLEMKFSSVEDLFVRFFKTTISGAYAKDCGWTKKRLLQLERSKLIRGIKSFSESTKFYVATFKGYYVISNHFPDKVIVKPLPGIDQRTFFHDKFVLRSRRELEESGKAVSWISDRKLRALPELTQGLSAQYIPDGIYETPEGRKVAFELEIAVKAKARYRHKIQKYVEIMRSKDETKRLFGKVFYVVSKDHVHDFLVRETKIYGDLFEVKKFKDFFTEVEKSPSLIEPIQVQK